MTENVVFIVRVGSRRAMTERKKKWKLETDKEEYEHAFVSSMMLNAAVSYDAKLLIGRPQFVGVDIIV